jgi:tetratricopeptide (TPR) repeat protein/transcriptional regulator with XRE-family HTH domain
MADTGTEALWRAARQTFGGRLRALRKDVGLSQTQLATKMGSSDSTLSELERGVGVRPPDAATVLNYVDRCLENAPSDKAIKDARRTALLGELHRLEELYEQLEQLPGQEPGLPSSPSTLSTLRRETHAFTGRADALAVIRAAVTRSSAGSHPVIAVHAVDGMPGVGKTAFAIHAARQIAQHFPDGQLFIDLHGHSPSRSPVDPRDALASLLTTWDVNPLLLPTDLDDRAALWRSTIAGKRVLLVLDNAADQAQIDPLLPGEGTCLVLVTSRRRLTGLDGVSIDLTPLADAEGEQMFRSLAGRPVAETEALNELVRLCGGLPLAIAILAARFRNRRPLTVAHIVSELTEVGNRLRAMRVPERAVAAAFELSYRDLPPERQLFFRRLGLHPGEGIERFAAAAVCGTDVTTAGDNLDRFYHDHLVEEVRLGRYRMHDLIAEYAQDLVHADDPRSNAAARESLEDFYEQTAGIAGDILVHGPRDGDQETWYSGALPPIEDATAAMDWFDNERDNLLELMNGTEAPRRITGVTLSLAPYVRRTGPWDLTLRLMRRAADAARRTDDVDAQGRTLLELGKAEFYFDHYDEAQVALRAAGRIFEDRRDNTFLAQVMMTLGQVWLQTGQHSDARDAYHRALAAHEQECDVRQAADVLVELGTVHYYADEYDASIRANQRALSTYEEIDDREGQATALKGMAHAWLFSDDYPQALRAASRARKLFRENRSRLGEAQTTAVIGAVHRARGNFLEARTEFEAALEAFEELGDRAGKAMTLIELGIVLHHLSDFEGGEQRLRAALDLYEEFGELMGKASAYKELADLLTKAGRLREARPMLDEAEAIYEKLDDRLGKAATSNSYGTLHLASNDPRAAHRRHTEALRLAVEIASSAEEAAALTGLGHVARMLGEHEESRRAFTAALEIYNRIGTADTADIAKYVHPHQSDPDGTKP